MLGDAFPRQRREIERPGGERIEPRLDIGEFQYVADLAVQAATGLADIAGIFGVFGMAGGTEKAVRDDVGEADNGVERGAQFMAHMGDEFRF